jgi:hypothetical protein
MQAYTSLYKAKIQYLKIGGILYRTEQQIKGVQKLKTKKVTDCKRLELVYTLLIR